MPQCFSYCKFKKNLILLLVFITIIIILALTINIRSTVPLKGVFRSVSIVYLRELTCQNRQCVHKKLNALPFDSTVICFDLEFHTLDINFESLHRRGVNMLLNIHGTQYELSQHKLFLQNVEI